MIKSFIRDESGATAIEYGLIGTLISIAIIVGATSLGSTLNGKYNGIATSVDTAITG
ncbi:MAG: Flp family type IVb pilin [Pseudomonadota bacterium]